MSDNATSTGQSPATTAAADSGAPAVRLKDVHVEFPVGDGTMRTVLNGIDLEIPRGQFLTVIGKSGCGKTTILNMVAGLLDASSGTVEVLGTSARAARVKMGFMLARDALFPWRTAAKNVAYGLELRGVPKAERRSRVARWLEAVHLSEHANKWPWQLSQGMRQRVALARTWALDPELLLMDEPFAALDVTTRRSAQAEFLNLWQSEPHRSVLFVTHDLVEAVALSDRTVVVESGRIVADIDINIQRPRDLATLPLDPTFQEKYEQLRQLLA